MVIHKKFLNANLFLIKTFLIAKFDCIFLFRKTTLQLRDQEGQSSADISGEPRKNKTNIELDHRTIKQWKDHDKPDSVAIPIDKREALHGKALPTMLRQNYTEPRASHYNEYVSYVWCTLNRTTHKLSLWLIDYLANSYFILQIY